MVRMVSSLLLVLLPVLYAYRESDSMLSALTRDSKGPESEGDDTDANAMDENKEKEESVEGPKETTKSGEKTSDSDDQGVLDCHSQLKMPINWKVTFKTIEEMQDKVEKLVRVTNENSDPQDTWGGLAQTEAENEGNIRLFLGAEVWFDGQKKDGKDCSITAEDLRLSSKIDCTEPGELIKTEESKTEDGHEVFHLKTSNSTLVLERQAAPDKDEPLVGDWTFESGDFKIVKKDSGLELEQKFWNKTIACSANLTKKDSDDKHYTANLVVKGSDCKNFKLRDCPTELCQADKNNSKCEAAKDLTFGFVKLELESDNNAIKRTVSASEAAPGKSFNVKRSFVAVDAEADAFVCVKVNETWEPIRGISYKQLANGGSQKQEIQKAEESKGTKIFEGKSIGKDWVQEDHVMEDSIFTKDEYLPPWKKSIQATVQWKKAVMCPEKFSLCYKDGDCVSEDCKNGCEWSRSPTVDAKTDMDYNYIAGADTLGTACDKSNEAMGKSKNAASGKSFLSLLLVAAFFRA